MKRNSRRAASMLGLVLLLAMPPAGAIAEPDVAPDTVEWSWDKFFDYSGCALAIAFATTGAGVTLAVFACARVIVKYSTI